MGRVRGAVNARALSLARKAVDLCNCWRREATAECLVEKQVELVSLGEDPIMVVATLSLGVLLANQDTELTQDHSGRKAASRNSRGRCGGPPCPERHGCQSGVSRPIHIWSVLEPFAL